jgi:hypothetical protein
MTPHEAKSLPHFRHVKTGGIYVELMRGKLEATLEPVVIYESVSGGEIWVRPAAEFDDGRFEKIYVKGPTDPISREFP